MVRYWESGGPLMLPIALASTGIWFYFIRSRRWLHAAAATADHAERWLDETRDGLALDAQLERWRARPGFLPQAVTQAMEAWRRRESPADAFRRVQESATLHLGRDLVVLAALTSAAPLLGLLGTVLGMIATFQAVAQASGETAVRVAGGISQALITTQFGLVVAIPGVFGVARLQRLQDQVQVAFQACRSRLLMVLARPGDGRGEAPR